MQKLWAKDIGFASCWGGFSILTSSAIFLCGICNFLGRYSEGIIFMDWSRCSCKFDSIHMWWAFLLFCMKEECGSTPFCFFIWLSCVIVRCAIYQANVFCLSFCSDVRTLNKFPHTCCYFCFLIQP